MKTCEAVCSLFSVLVTRHLSFIVFNFQFSIFNSPLEAHMQDFAGQGAIVTGGASGIGRAVADLLAERGAMVVIADRNRERAFQAAAEINASIGRTAALAAPADLTKADEVAHMVAQAHEFLPAINV